MEMKAVKFDGIRLMNASVDMPVLGKHDLLVRVEAISVNPIDIKIRDQWLAAGTSGVLGWDVAGVVTETGEGCRLYQPGDKVYYAGDLLRSGGNSEFHAVNECLVGRKPKSLTYAEAAALPLTGITAWEGLFDRLGISKKSSENWGKTILFIGSAGGVGSIATQIAREVGLTVIGTASRKASIRWTKNRGAQFVLDHTKPLLPQIERIGYAEVDYIFCLQQTEDYFDEMTKMIAPEGRICAIVETDQKLDMTQLQSKSVTFCWEFVFTRPIYRTYRIRHFEILNELSRWIDAGKITTTSTRCMEPICAERISSAHHQIESKHTIGKIVIKNSGGDEK